MFNKEGSLALTILGCILSILLVASCLGGLPLTARAASIDNGFAIGAYYQYTAGSSDFNFYFFCNGFTSSNGNPEQIVLTVTTGDQVSYQIGIFVYSGSNVQLDDEAWQISGTPHILWHHNYAVSGIIGTMHVIRLAIFASNGHKYVGYYLDGTQYDSWMSQFSNFDNEMAPSVVIESADTSASDWIGKNAQGYLRTGTTNLHTWFYGGTWGVTNAGCYAVQTSSLYVGENTQAPNIVGTTGYNMGLGASTCYIGIGNMNAIFFITDQTISNEYSTFQANSCFVKVS